jgi:F-type H+-transporting ATPase subunit delta
MSANAQTLARPYARAAFDLARADGLLADWSNRLLFAAAVAAAPQVAPVLAHPGMAQADQVALLLPQGDTADGTFGRFLATLAGNRRLPLLPQIAGQYEALRAESERIVKARVRSAVALEPAQLETLKGALKRRLGRDVELRNEVDPAVIGGAVIDAGDIVIDGSVRGRLAKLGAALTH